VKEETARSLLSDVKSDSFFKVHMERTSGISMSCGDALTIISDDSFHHHVTEHKNDFSIWVKNVVKDQELAKSIEHIKDRQKMRDIVSVRIEELESQAIGETFSSDTKDRA